MIYVGFQKYIRARMILIQKNIKNKLKINYGNKLVCVCNKFSKYFKPYLVKNVEPNFINNFIKESKYCNNVMKKTF